MSKYHIKQTDKETLRNWFYLMTLGRAIDNKAPNYLKQAIGWSYHAPFAGHDGIQLAIGQIFDKNTDHLFPYYRDMLTAISAGLTATETILNGISKATDVAGGGRHMSNHFAKPEWNIHNVSSCTGNHTLHAVGVGRAMKRYNHKGVSISSQGESSVSEGYVYEAINGASNEKLPVLFVFQDNGYGISVPKKDQTANRKVANNFTGLKNLKIFHCNGKDVFDSMNVMTEAKQWIIENQMPAIVQANCIRMHSHSNSDRHELYRDEHERNYVMEYDPLAKYRRLLVRYERFTEDELLDIEAQVKEEVKKAHKEAMAAPDPDPGSIFDFVLPEPYPASKYPEGLHQYEGEPKKLIEGINETLKAEFRHNPDTYIWGQDIAHKEKGGIFNVSKGMQQEFGIDRVFNAPIAEDFIMGTANGMSRFSDKIRIVVEGAEFADYFWPAMEQYIDSSHDYWRSNGAFTPNVTIRLASGGYIGGGLYHSQNIEGALASIPGVRIVYPSYADDAAGLLRTSMRSRGMTLFLEPKALYNDPVASSPVPDDFEVPFGKAKIRLAGTDLSIVTYGNTTHMCMDVAKKLEETDGIHAEVIDLRSLVPLDEETILASVKKTGKVLIVHEDKVFGGFGGEVASIINEKAFEWLDGPVKRIGSTFTPVGFNRILEKAILPNVDKIYASALELIAF
ncbi:MAG TPA: 2-oxoisovalerate dehydrogenase [Marinilabiliales bacterium]|nr:MAG: 2-oxoisovalerate dehydrogenase [Bacteroidetes bacterium GWA2_40_14]OFX63335.1 MAG: 2-oxoisovalerate dehydrogenase [Bacteroidetes bacterium GWC2_40_13]OFX74671.1 MAG: 2-oxoisovalerate dehydrogenase [Bacteroidetes bacterium GWD2_40_43]OFX88993.1 MAG: 2-oxoisovalerate dehydrogenase [Bacteroidetes bacterium GWE2_40_63]OFY22798.1 MAG: 2-oxoisovalerate dehydrogenase [Bacteroidetes bacterium GWF2_40_13]OFZ32151.1 MAG: 2-oxoisovalerate dehydrogenase [Bacteroidetes bacterium RIFOXYC2_FULL_40_12